MGSFGGALYFAFRRSALAEWDTKGGDSWALLSDIHLASERSFVFRGVNMTEHFRSVSRELLALADGLPNVLITGDCAYSSGEKGDYAVLGDLLEPIRRRHEQRMRHAYAVDRAARGVDGDRLHRGRTDVDADGHRSRR